MNDKKTQPIFLGGFTGIVKNKNYSNCGEKFYRLYFAVPQNDENHFGFQAPSISVKENTYNEFMTKAKPNSYINATVCYVRGGWALIDYIL